MQRPWQAPAGEPNQDDAAAADAQVAQPPELEVPAAEPDQDGAAAAVKCELSLGQHRDGAEAVEVGLRSCEATASNPQFGQDGLPSCAPPQVELGGDGDALEAPCLQAATEAVPVPAVLPSPVTNAHADGHPRADEDGHMGIDGLPETALSTAGAISAADQPSTGLAERRLPAPLAAGTQDVAQSRAKADALGTGKEAPRPAEQVEPQPDLAPEDAGSAAASLDSVDWERVLAAPVEEVCQDKNETIVRH